MGADSGSIPEKGHHHKFNKKCSALAVSVTSTSPSSQDEWPWSRGARSRIADSCNRRRSLSLTAAALIVTGEIILPENPTPSPPPFHPKLCRMDSGNPRKSICTNFWTLSENTQQFLPLLCWFRAACTCKAAISSNPFSALTSECLNVIALIPSFKWQKIYYNEHSYIERIGTHPISVTLQSCYIYK